MSSWIVLFFLSSFFVGCENGVYYNEMPIQPLLIIKGNVLTIKSSNSIKNSAQLIYKVYIISVDQNKKIVYIAAKQSIGMPYRDTFRINLDDYKIFNTEAYQYYWCNPDKKMTTMKVSWEK